MSSNYRRREGEIFGGWTLIEPLGKGGNAEVWKATSEDGRAAALKVLNSRNPDSEPYKRFRAEINLLRSLGQRAGVLPLIDATLPEQPSNQNPAWFVMPVATSISEALGQQPGLAIVVEAIATIAEALASLAAQGISHRDIKPGNLYQFEGQWTIGDFGLAEYPDKEALTEEGRTLGPRYFLAPEMITDPKNADGHKADVYSLAKTLWVLATGNIFPPQGEQRIETRQINIGAYVPHPKTRSLDRLIEYATKHAPQDRLTMDKMAAELRAWLAPSAEPTSPEDLTDLATRIATAIEPARRADKKREQWQIEGEDALEVVVNQMERLLGPIARATHAHADIRQDYTVLDMFKYVPAVGEPDVIWRDGHCIFVKGPGAYSIFYWCGVGAEVFDDSTLHLVAAHIVQMGQTYPDVIWNFDSTVQLGSASQEQAITELMNGLTENLRAAMESYAELVESTSEY